MVYIQLAMIDIAFSSIFFLSGPSALPRKQSRASNPRTMSLSLPAGGKRETAAAATMRQTSIAAVSGSQRQAVASRHSVCHLLLLRSCAHLTHSADAALQASTSTVSGAYRAAKHHLSVAYARDAG